MHCRKPSFSVLTKGYIIDSRLQIAGCRLQIDFGLQTGETAINLQSELCNLQC